MANCKDCGAKFSCGCSLVNGRCSKCNYTYQQSTQKSIKPYSDYDKSKIGKL